MNDRDRPDIVEVMQQRGIEFCSSGRELGALCCFHEDKNPSMFANREKQLFHCFGCGAGGDVFDFIMLLDGVTFAEAARSLGVKGRRSERRTVNQTAVEMSSWANGETARAYAVLREIDQRLLRAEELGLEEESAICRRETVILEDLAQDLQTAKFVIELHAIRPGVEQLLSDADIYWTPPQFPE